MESSISKSSQPNKFTRCARVQHRSIKMIHDRERNVAVTAIAWSTQSYMAKMQDGRSKHEAYGVVVSASGGSF